MTEINRYNNGKIYKLVSNETDKIYIGSTCKERLCQRLSQHKRSYKYWLKNEKKYISSFELFKSGVVEIVLLETINCNTKDELLKKEREYIDKYKDIIINKQIPITTKEEQKEYQKERTKKHYEKNKEEINKKSKEYRNENIEKFKERNKEYYDKNKEEINEKRKEYRNENIEKIKERKKDYYEKNKEEINKIIECECKSKYTYHHKSRHEKSIKHKNYINSLQS